MERTFLSVQDTKKMWQKGEAQNDINVKINKEACNKPIKMEEIRPRTLKANEEKELQFHIIAHNKRLINFANNYNCVSYLLLIYKRLQSLER